VGSEPNRERLTMSIGWSFVETAARLLARNERKGVLGDLVEAGESATGLLSCWSYCSVDKLGVQL
jgi:hypothetical protein